jgi:DNA-binding XRE family transcriptional regulator
MSQIKEYTLEEIEDEMIGPKGTPERDRYESEYEQFLIGETIKQARKQKQLTQAQLGDLIGVKKSRISKIENGENLSFGAVIRVFKAMGISATLNLKNIGELALC